jgi:hypothetical protein
MGNRSENVSVFPVRPLTGTAPDAGDCGRGDLPARVTGARQTRPSRQVGHTIIKLHAIIS